MVPFTPPTEEPPYPQIHYPPHLHEHDQSVRIDIIWALLGTLTRQWSAKRMNPGAHYHIKRHWVFGAGHVVTPGDAPPPPTDMSSLVRRSKTENTQISIDSLVVKPVSSLSHSSSLHIYYCNVPSWTRYYHQSETRQASCRSVCSCADFLNCWGGEPPALNEKLSAQ